MNSFSSFSELLKKVSSKQAVEHRLLYPQRDWGIVLLANCALLVCMVIYAVSVFAGVQKDNSAGGIKAPESTVDVQTLDSALEFFRERERTYDDLMLNPGKAIDPYR